MIVKRLPLEKTFVYDVSRLCAAPAAAAQADWYEAWAIMSGEPVKLQVFDIRSMANGAADHRAYRLRDRVKFKAAP